MIKSKNKTANEYRKEKRKDKDTGRGKRVKKLGDGPARYRCASIEREKMQIVNGKVRDLETPNYEYERRKEIQGFGHIRCCVMLRQYMYG